MRFFGIFEEWFIPGESDLLVFGLILIILSVMLPMDMQKRQPIRIAAMFGAYVICEVLMVLVRGYLWQFVCLGIGGVMFSAALGRTAKYVLKKHGEGKEEKQ